MFLAASASMTTIMEMAEHYDNFFFDCDGVVWRSNEQIGDAFDKIVQLEQMGKRVFFVTNNATKLPNSACEKMRGMGYNSVKQNTVYTSAGCVAKYIVRKYPEFRKIFAIGESSIRQALEDEGIEVIGADQHVLDPSEIVTEDKYDKLELDPGIKAVVYGLDFSFTHQKMCLACLYIREQKVPLIVTNDDRGVKIRNKLFPGAGTILQSILTGCDLHKANISGSTSDEPGTFELIGKPNPFMIDLIKEEHQLPEESRSVMIGDRPNTDILFGKAAGIDQCLVLSGVVHSVEDFEQNWLPEDPNYDPTWIMQQVGA